MTNLECESIALENINPFVIYNLSTVVEKALEFMLTIPIDLYRLKEISKSWLGTNLVDNLPNIGGGKNVKTLEEIKLELVQASLEKLERKTPAKIAMNRSNSIEVVKRDEVADNVDVKQVEDKSSVIFDLKSFECILCFDSKQNLDECVVIKSCAHRICVSCMQAYIDSHLFNSHLNASSLQCPGCNTYLELALMINYASNANMMEIFIKHTIERVVFVLNEYKWCPSPFCGMLEMIFILFIY